MNIQQHIHQHVNSPLFRGVAPQDGDVLEQRSPLIHQFNIDSTNDDPNNIDISNDNNNINESNDETVGEPDDNMDNNDSQGEASSSGDNGTGDNGSGYEDTNNNKVDDIPPKKTTKQKMKGQLELSTFHDFWEKLLAKQPNAKYVERS